jgi:hypothetical protein
MMTFTLKADIPLLSINKAYITLKNGRRCRSKEYNVFSCSISRLLNANRAAFIAFDNYFDPYKHEVYASLIFYTDELFTKDGKISQKSGDLGNVEKCITDCVLVGKVDDSYITSWSLVKRYRAIKGFDLTFIIADR